MKLSHSQIFSHQAGLEHAAWVQKHNQLCYTSLHHRMGAPSSPAPMSPAPKSSEKNLPLPLFQGKTNKQTKTLELLLWYAE